MLGAAPADTAWVITVTLLAAAVTTPIAGKLGDMFGKRRVAVVLMTVLLAGSLVCAAAPGVAALIVGRALQGTGMGVIPLGISLLRVLQLHAGESVWTPHGEEHWHGGRPDQMMCHYAILDETDAGDATTWLKPVTDYDYDEACRRR